jgi:hypothetical protein
MLILTNVALHKTPVHLLARLHFTYLTATTNEITPTALARRVTNNKVQQLE